MALTAEIKNNQLHIVVDLQEPRPSSSGKTLLVATSGGNVPLPVQVDGRLVTLGLNAYIKA